MSIAEVRAKAVPILKRHGARRAGLFGSVVRGDDQAGSDVDFWLSWMENRVCSTSSA
jgi:predicted nucleotidyltransferase